MTVVYIRRNPLDPRKTINYLDSCAFNPHAGEIEAARKMLALHHSNQVIIAIPKSVKTELDCAGTPTEIRELSGGMFWAFAPSLTPAEQIKKERVYSIVIGNGKPENFEADASHVFEVGRRRGYFITVDGRLLDKRAALKEACGVVILTPTEWLTIFQQTAPLLG
ncbi:MAG: hypothetical protein V4634_11520 [Pseudomonadota bacterium]